MIGEPDAEEVASAKVQFAGRTAGRAGPPLLFAGGVIVAWYLVAEILPESKRVLLPKPHELWTEALARQEIRDELWKGLINTTKVSLMALVIAIGLGVLIATVMSQRHFVERALFPWAVVLQTIPTLALVPLIGVWFGFGFFSRVLVAVLIALFPIITNTLFGLHSADPAQHDLFHLHKASSITRLFRLQFPAALPAILTGFRISAGLSVIGAIVGEFFFGRGAKGLGNLIDKYRGILDVGSLYTTIIISSVLGVTIFSVFTWLMKAAVGSWHESLAENP
jgi:NitT/TauT family transport system permease protein